MKYISEMTYKGKTISTTGGGSSEVAFTSDGIEMFRSHLKRVTDQAFIDKIKNLPVTSGK
ncbi:MAG: hypothetical protein ACTTJ7_01635 [Treponema sp.]